METKSKICQWNIVVIDIQFYGMLCGKNNVTVNKITAISLAWEIYIAVDSDHVQTHKSNCAISYYITVRVIYPICVFMDVLLLNGKYSFLQSTARNMTCIYNNSIPSYRLSRSFVFRKTNRTLSWSFLSERRVLVGTELF